MRSILTDRQTDRQTDCLSVDRSRVFEEFVKEIESVTSQPIREPYPLDGYGEKEKRALQDLEQNRNVPWIKEVWERQKNNLDAPALKYRGQIYTYKEFFTMSYRYAKALKSNGLKRVRSLSVA